MPQQTGALPNNGRWLRGCLSEARAGTAAPRSVEPQRAGPSSFLDGSEDMPWPNKTQSISQAQPCREGGGLPGSAPCRNDRSLARSGALLRRHGDDWRKIDEAAKGVQGQELIMAVEPDILAIIADAVQNANVNRPSLGSGFSQARATCLPKTANIRRRNPGAPFGLWLRSSKEGRLIQSVAGPDSHCKAA